MYRTVQIGRRIGGEELERILIEAAEEVGLRAKSVDTHKTVYRLGSVHKEQVYDGTDVRLTWRVLTIAEISGIKKGEERDWFSIGTRTHIAPPYFGFGSESQIERYLSAVSQRINQIPPNNPTP